MFLSAVRSVVLYAGVLVALALVLAGGVTLLDGGVVASAFLRVILRDMQGVWVFSLGWGLAAFVRAEGRGFANDLTSMLEPSPTVAQLVAIVERSTQHRAALPVTVPLSVVGFILTMAYGVPLDGAARWVVTIGVTSIYYVAAFLLWHFVGVIRGFNAIYHNIQGVDFRQAANPLHLENALNYLSITTVIGVLAIYAGFRGTLTAGFRFPYEALRPFLVTPLILFLPGTLFYNFHPRYVLRRVVQHKVFTTMNRLSKTASADIPGVIVELKDLGLTNAQILPFIDAKSVPSYLISILFVLSLAYHNDPAVKAFLSYVLGLQE